MAQLYPQALAFLFVASYDSQGYGGVEVFEPASTRETFIYRYIFKVYIISYSAPLS
jgi:hypothetical protein